MNTRIAHKIVRRYQAFPRKYALDQIKEAHGLLSLEVDPEGLTAWRKAHGLEDLPSETIVKVGVVEAKVEAGADGVLGTPDDKVTIQKSGAAENLAAISAELEVVAGLISGAEGKGDAPAVYKLEAYRVFLEAQASGDPLPEIDLPAVYEDCSVAHLKILAKAKGLKGYSKLKKAELIELLREG